MKDKELPKQPLDKQLLAKLGTQHPAAKYLGASPSLDLRMPTVYYVGANMNDAKLRLHSENDIQLAYLTDFSEFSMTRMIRFALLLRG